MYVSYRFDVLSAAGSPSFDGEVQLKLQGQGEEGPDTGCLTLGTGSGDGNAGLFQVRGTRQYGLLHLNSG